MPPLINGDVKTNAASSAESATAGSEQQKPDAIESSSDSNANGGLDVKPGQSMQDFVNATLAQKEATVSEVEEDEDGEAKEKSDSENELDKEKGDKLGDEEEDGTEKKKDGEEGEDDEKGDKVDKKEETESKDKADDKGPIPYERFQEVVTEKNTMKKQLDEAKPKLTSYDNITRFCGQNRITPSDFEQCLQTQALLSSNQPEEALKVLGPIVDALRGATGDKLPDDIQAKVDKGTLELEDAKEMAKLRAQTKIGARTAQQTQQQREEQQQQEYHRQLTSAVNDWEQRKQVADPDYKPKAKDTDPDSKWEDVRDKYLAMLNLQGSDGKYVNPVTNTTEMIALMDKAYAQVNAKYKHLKGVKSATRKTLPSNGSSTTTETIENAPNMAEAIKRAVGNRT